MNKIHFKHRLRAMLHRLTIPLLFVVIVLFGFAAYLLHQAPGMASTNFNGNSVGSLSAKRSFDFTDSVGVVTHLSYIQYQENYYQRNVTAMTTNINNLITNLGVKHIREGVTGTSDYTQNAGYGVYSVHLYNELKTLSDSGIKFLLVASGSHIITCSQLSTDAIATVTNAQCIYGLNSGDPSYASTQIVMPSDTSAQIISDVTKMRAAGVVADALEGYNEYHTGIPSSLSGKKWYEIYPANWQEVIGLQTRNVIVPAASSLGLPTVGPSFVPDFGNSGGGCATWLNYSPPLFAPDPATPHCTAPPTSVGDLSGVVTYSNTHAYHSTFPGGPANFLSYNKVLNWWTSVYGSAPKIFTEVGYQDSAFSPTVQEKYMTRLLFELFNQNVKRTYIYELLDEIDAATPSVRSDLGLAGFNADGSIRVKPVYTALKNTLTILKDPTGTSFTTSNLGITITDPSNGSLHKTVLQNKAGEHFLALWNEKSASSNDTDANISNVMLTFGGNTDVSFYRPSVSPTASQTKTAVASYTLNVPDDIVIIKITDTPTATTNPNTGGGSTSGGTSGGGTSSGTSKGTTTTPSSTTTDQATPNTDTSTPDASGISQPLKVLSDVFFPNASSGNSAKPLAYLFVFILSTIVLVVMALRDFFRPPA